MVGIPCICLKDLTPLIKDYLHSLYFARGFLAEAQCFVHLSNRLGYLIGACAEAINAQTRNTFVVLHGLIWAVDKDVGIFSKVAARIASFVALALSPASSP